jgi:hypothetical protein
MDKKVTAKEAYGVLDKVFSDSKMAAIFEELDTNEAAREKAKKDAHAYLTGHGVVLPKDVTAKFATTNSWRFSLCFFLFCISFEHS